MDSQDNHGPGIPGAPRRLQELLDSPLHAIAQSRGAGAFELLHESLHLQEAGLAHQGVGS
jgi:hypothetical protein